MKFDNSVDLPLRVDAAWDVLLDVPRIASCLPGAELTEIENEHNFKGNVSIKLGPVALTFTGRAKIESIDAVAHRARIKAQGLDSKGRGGASATVDFELTPHSKGSTVLVHTDLTLNGAVAQYGRGSGLIREVAATLLSQFADSLQAKLMTEGAPSIEAAPSNRLAEVSVLRDERRPAKPISGVSLFFKALWRMLKRAP